MKHFAQPALIFGSLFLLIYLIFVSGCTPGPGPKKVAEEFLTAIDYGDFDRAKELASESSQGALETLSAFGGRKNGEMNAEISRVEVDDNYAKAYYTVDTDEEEHVLRLKRDKQKGWLVIFEKSDMPRGGSGDNVDLDINLDEEKVKKGVGKFMEGMGKVLDTLGNAMEKAGKEMEVEIEKERK